MKIVYCIAGTHNSGGMERVLANKANFLAQHGHDIVILTTDQQGRKPYFEMDSSIIHKDFNINYIEDTSKGILNRVVLFLVKQNLHKKRLKKLLAELNADVVISMFDHDASFLYKIKDGSKKVLEIHFSRYKRLQYGRKGLNGLIDRLRSGNDLSIAKKYDRFVVLTHEDKSYWGNLENIQVIPNANSFVPNGFAKMTNKQVIAVGRYDYQKGFDDLIKAWAIVHKKQADWKLKIYGSGPLKSDLQRLICELGLEESVELCPPVQNIEKEYKSSSILAMTSRYEGLPMVLLEGQSCGLPMVSYACKCGPTDIIDEGKNGYLVDEGDIPSFAEKLIFLMENRDLRTQMGLESQVKSKDFSEDVIMKQWTDLFDTLLTKAQ